jgi:hypothetical protein
VTVFLLVALAVSLYFFPMWAGIPAEYRFLASHWWLPTWR